MVFSWWAFFIELFPVRLAIHALFTFLLSPAICDTISSLPRGLWAQNGHRYMRMSNCENFAFFRTYLFARALLVKTHITPTQEGRPDPLVEVWARSEHCSSRGELSKVFFSRWGLTRRFPGFLRMRPILYVRTGKISLFLLLSHEHTAQDIHHR